MVTIRLKLKILSFAGNGMWNLLPNQKLLQEGGILIAFVLLTTMRIREREILKSRPVRKMSVGKLRFHFSPIPEPRLNWIDEPQF